MRKKIGILGTLFFLMVMPAVAQMGVTEDLLSITPDARANALGDGGVATDADVYSMFYNPAKYAFLQEKLSFGLGYVPVRRNLYADQSFSCLAAAYKINDRSAIASTLRYINEGEIDFISSTSEEHGTYRLFGWALEASYSYRFGNYFSVGVAGRFLYSNDILTTDAQGNMMANSSIAIAGDVAAYYRRPINSLLDLSLGASVTNIGTTLSQLSEKRPLPMRLQLGAGSSFTLSPKNTLSVNAQFSYLLASNVWGVPSKINIGGGIEYWHNRKYGLRAGYFHQTPQKGYYSSEKGNVVFGGAFKFKWFGVNASYLIPVGTVPGTHPWGNTLRVDLTFGFGKK